MQQTQQTNNQSQPATAETDQGNRSPVETVRSGSIGASIWQETSQGGKEYYAITVSRSWKANDSDEYRYSNRYFSRNREDLHKAIDQACDRVEALEGGSGPQQS